MKEFKLVDWQVMPTKINSNGYLQVFYPEHPNNVHGWVLLHRLIYEDYVKRYLTDLEVVHHVNELKTCNEIWNLFLCSESEHTIIHRMGKRHTKKAAASMSKAHKVLAKKRKRGEHGYFIKD